MELLGLVVAILAAAVHVYIFTLESVTWTSASTRRVFGTTFEQAEATRELAYNQGFYNLFLAVEVALGVALLGMGWRPAGLALTLFGVGSMLAAALVLFVTSPDKRRSAVMQGTLPLIALASTGLSLLV